MLPPARGYFMPGGVSWPGVLGRPESGPDTRAVRRRSYRGLNLEDLGAPGSCQRKTTVSLEAGRRRRTPSSALSGRCSGLRAVQALGRTGLRPHTRVSDVLGAPFGRNQSWDILLPRQTMHDLVELAGVRSRSSRDSARQPARSYASPPGGRRPPACGRPRHRRRQGALRQAVVHGRGGLRQHQGQPPVPSVLTTRPEGCAQ